MAATVPVSRTSPPNRRSRVRQKIHVPAYASFISASSGGAHNLCQLLDISESGLALQCGTPMELNFLLDLRLNLAEGGGEISAPARVAWFDAAGRAGFQLSLSDPRASRRLREWLLLNALAAAANAESSSLPSGTPDAPAIRQNYTDMLSAASAVQREAESLGPDLEAVLSLIASRSLSLFRASGAAIALAGQDPATLICRASAGESSPPVGAAVQVGSGFSGECVRTAKLLRCDDAETDPRVDRESCLALGIRSMLAAPIRSGEKSIGLLELFSAHPRAFTENDGAVLQRFAEMILAAVNRVVPPDPPPTPLTPKPFSPAPGSVLFAHPPEEAPEKKSPASDQDLVGGIRLPRFHLVLLVAAAATIFLALGFLTAPWIQPWVQEKLHGHSQNLEQTVLASSKPPTDGSNAPAPNISADSANLPQLRELAQRGDPAAENALGLLYSSGDDKQGIRRDESEAARWFTKAAEDGNVPAQSKLGSLSWAGRGVAKDDNRAYFWTVLARANGDPAAKVLAPFIASRLTLPQRAAIEQQAEQWLQQRESRAKPAPGR